MTGVHDHSLPVCPACGHPPVTARPVGDGDGQPLTALEWLRVTHADTLSGRRIEEALAAERERVAAPIRALADELERDRDAAYQRVAGRHHNDYDAGMETAYDSAAERLRAALDGDAPC